MARIEQARCTMPRQDFLRRSQAGKFRTVKTFRITGIQCLAEKFRPFWGIAQPLDIIRRFDVHMLTRNLVVLLKQKTPDTRWPALYLRCLLKNKLPPSVP